MGITTIKEIIENLFWWPHDKIIKYYIERKSINKCDIHFVHGYSNELCSISKYFWNKENVRKYCKLENRFPNSKETVRKKKFPYYAYCRCMEKT